MPPLVVGVLTAIAVQVLDETVSTHRIGCLIGSKTKAVNSYPDASLSNAPDSMSTGRESIARFAPGKRSSIQFPWSGFRETTRSQYPAVDMFNVSDRTGAPIKSRGCCG